jgi:serine/threonine protein kinase
MQRYRIEARLGVGTYGEVLRAVRKADGVRVAVKALKKEERANKMEDVQRLREVKALHQLAGHRNIVNLIEVRGGRLN